MSVRSFRSVFMASAVAGAALGCYLVSLRVASERAALDEVENRIALTQRDIRLLQTEIGTRARLAQLERWNVRVLSLSAPTADQILGDKFQLARLIQPERKLPVDAPVVLASAPAAQPQQPLAGSDADAVASAPAGQLLHEAGVKIAKPEAQTAKAPLPAPDKVSVATSADARSNEAKASQGRAVSSKRDESKGLAGDKKAGDKSPKPAAPAVTPPVRTANVDPLAPLSAEHSTAKGSRTDR